ncbi:hypothetical protein I2750_13620 [Bacillus sp. PR5]|uniref:hypothetical protein n=1 Tax=Bacillus cereus TaxID=1396 RepID=UPI000BF48F51|nr:hypothetical protein [Bacillus cereus]MBJ6721276.1 hypothetical protein [Bacillus sp. PR5]MCU5081626.1 hypothetical protein [Bacillus cereus]MEB9973482.1 hypothetical protein [Bacillus cereus]PFI81137.1 hypothetical protein COI83_15205 [Bacillus cereus]
MKNFISFFVSIIIIYGMFFSQYHLSPNTDKSYKFFWVEYKFEDSKDVVIKDNLSFVDGLQNGTTLWVKSIKSLFVGGWNIYDSLRLYVSILNINFLLKLVLHLVVIFASLIIAFLAMFAAIIVFFYKLLFFKASISYYIGFCVSFFGILRLSQLVDDSPSKKGLMTKHPNSFMRLAK